MDVLRFFKSALFFILKIFSKVFKFLAFLLKSIVGDIKWSSPFWFSYVKKAFKILGGKTLKHYKAILITFCVIAIAAFGSYYGYIWKQNQPKPIEIAPIEYQTYSASLGSPSVTNYRYDKPIVYPLYVYFDGDVAPVESVGKNVTEGISLTPHVNGEWVWFNSKILEFKPANESDWAIGESYTVKINPKKLLPEQILISSTEYNFVTREFYYTIDYRELYQNPEKPSEKNVIYEVSFLHPVDAASFEKQISLNLIALGKDKVAPKPYKFAVKYDDKKLKAWIRSEFVTLPEVDSDMVLKIGKGVKSSLGGAATNSEKTSYQEVTSAYRDIIKNIFLTLAESEDNEQEQVLVVTLVDNVNINDLSKQIKAWILPKDKPKINNNNEIKNYRWSNYDDISNEILAKATPLTLAKDNSETDMQNIISFKYKASPKDYIYVTVGNNIETVGGYKAKSGKRSVLSVPEFPQTLSFADSGSILSLKGERKISIVSRNIKGVDLNIKRVIPSQLHHLMTFGRYYDNFDEASFRDDENYYDRYDSSEHFTEIFSHKQKINEMNPNKITYTGVDLTNYLLNSANGRQGVFLVTLNSWNPDTNATGYETISKLVVVTDIGLIIKRSADGSSDVFAQSIKNSTPLEGVKISVLGKNGIQIASAITDADGHVRIKNLKEFKNEKEPTIFIAQKDGDTSFLPAFYNNNGKYGDRRLEFSRFDIGGVSNVLEQGRLSAYLFSDRGLYRPGDSVNIGTIVRAENWDIGVGGIPVIATIYDPRGQVFESIPLVLDESGFNELSFTTTEASPTGNWIINLSVASNFNDKSKAGIFLGSVNVAVREFEPDRMKVDLKLSPTDIKGWIKPDELQALIRVENLFGAPAQNRRVSSTLILNPTDFYFGEHKNYHFYDGRRSSRQDKFEIKLEDVLTDDNGEAKLSLLLEEHERASYHLSIITEAFEQGSGRGVSATAKAVISPNDYLVGAKADGDLGYIKKDAIRTLNFIAIDQNLSKIVLDNLTLEIIEQKYVSVLTLQNSGVYKYQSKLQEVSIDEQDFSIEKSGTDYLLNSKKPGTYKLLVKNEKSDTLYRSYYAIVGDANIDRSLERNSELEMKLSKGEYKNGDEIEISINTPYVGSGLITIEKDKVYAWKWFKASTTSSTQKITVPRELKGNGYINVQFVRDPNSDDIFMSPLSYGVLPFKVTMEKESASVRLSSTKLIKPGEDVDITINTDRNQKVVVFAVNEGILQVADYRLTNPLNFFFQKRYLEVSSYQILDLILPEFSKFERLMSAVGGDVEADEVSLSQRYQNPFKRKVDKPVVFWSGIIDVDGEKSFTYKVPDYFNGKLRVMAVAVSEKQIGIAQSDTIVRDDFVLTPNVPFTAALNDEFEVTLGVSNNLENVTKKAPVSISLVATPHVKVLGNSTAIIELAQKSEGYVKFKVKASGLGGGELMFRAAYFDEDNQINYLSQRVGTISVRPVTPFRTQSIMGRMGGDKEDIKDIRNMYDEYAIRYASVANTPMAISNGLTSYLDNYPYHCSEQIISNAISAMIQQKYSFLNRADVNKIPYENIAAILKSRQNSNGAIGLWRTTAYGDTFVSVYAAHYLIDAKENGIAVSFGLLESLNAYLTSLANDNSIEHMEGLRLRAYAVYLLTRQGIVTTNMLSSVQKSLQTHYENSWKSDVSALYLAATYKMLKMDKEADLLLQKPWSELNKAYNNAWWSRDYYDPLVINSTYIYLISKHFAEKVSDIPPQALENIVLMIRTNRFTTTSSAMSILAIESYSKQIENISNARGKNLSIEALSKGANSPHVIANESGIWAFGNFTKNDVNIIFNNPSKLPAWYSVVQEGYDEAAPSYAIKKGLEIYKEFTDESGKPIKSVKLGEKINVTVRVRSNSNEGIGNVAVLDLLPGGFEIVQQDRQSQDRYEYDEYDDEYEYDEYEDEYDDRFISPIGFSGTTWDIDYNDIREDRVIIYGTAQMQTKEFIYQIKSTNVGTYQIPPSFAEAMYDREIQAVSANIGNITVLPVE